MSASDAEYFTLISNYSSAELWDVEIISEVDFVRNLLINVIEVDILGAPFEVVDEFGWAVAFLQDKGVLEQFTELLHNVDIRVVCYSTREFSQFTLFPH